MWILFAALFYTTTVDANVKIENPSFIGNGCRRGEFDYVLSPDDAMLSVVFDNFMVEVSSPELARSRRALCQIRMTLTVPTNYQVAIVKMDARGFHSLPVQAEGDLMLRQTVSKWPMAAGMSTPDIDLKDHRKFLGPIDGDFIFEQSLSATPVWSACGKSLRLTVSIDYQILNLNDHESAFATIDTADIATAGLAYKLVTRHCRP